MLDYNDLDSLERYALAATFEERQQLVGSIGSGDTVVRPGEAFLAGLHALEAGDLDAATQMVRKLGATARYSEHFQRLEALVALRSWKTNPKATCAFLENSLGLSFNAPAPAAETSTEAAFSPPGGTPQEPSATTPRLLPSEIDPASYSAAAFLKQAVQLARGMGEGRNWNYVSLAGRLALLNRSEELDLGLTDEEKLELIGQNEEDGALNADEEHDSILGVLSGSPVLASAALQAVKGQKFNLLAALAERLTWEQVESLLFSSSSSSELPPAAVAALPEVLAAAVRKLYGVTGLTPAGAALAVDVPEAAAATQHSTPSMTAAEADAIRHRALELCARVKGAAANVDSGSLAWIEARALMPLTAAAVRAAAFAAAAAAAAPQQADGSASQTTPSAAAKAAEAAVALMSRLLRAVAAQGVADGGGLFAARYRQNTARSAPFQRGPGVESQPSLGPAMPRLPAGISQVLARLLTTLLHVAGGDPPALFAPGGPFEGLLDKPAETRLVAEAMLTRGSVPQAAPGSVPQAVDWAAAFKDAGGNLAALADEVELELTGPERAGEGAWEAPSDDVVLMLTHKAVRHISVLVYDIATEAYYKEKGAEVDMGVDLEGLGATFQFEIDLPYGLPALQRCRRAIPLPQLKGRRGVWVVDVQGGGRHSRALVRRGSLAAVVRPSPAGLALSLYREDGSAVTQPRVWVDGRMYLPTGGEGAGAAGGREVVVPYRASSSASVPAVLVDAGGDGGGEGGGGGGSSGFASLMTLNHLTEEYELRCAMHFEPETAAAGGRGGTAPLLLQPSLTVCGWQAPLELLQDVTLTVEVDDLDVVSGAAASGSGARQQVFQDWSPGDGLKAQVVQVRLPDRPGRVSAVLTARIRKVAHGSDGEPDYQTFRTESTWTVNETDAERDQFRDLYLTRGSDGGYVLRLLGRAGEPFPGVPLVVAMTHIFSKDSAPPRQSTSSGLPGDETTAGDHDIRSRALMVRQALVTDANGCVHLGHLRGITGLAAGVDSTPSAPPAGAGAAASGSSARVRRRYRWHLPHPATGVPRDGDFDDRADQPDRVLRGLEQSEGGAVQFSIPFAMPPLDALAMDVAGGGGGGGSAATADQDRDLLRRLGVVLVSCVAVEAPEDPRGGYQAQGGPPPQPPRQPYDRTEGQSVRQVAQRLDEHVAVRQGYLQVSGLPPGIYRLVTPALGPSYTLLVYRSPVVTPAVAGSAAAGGAGGCGGSGGQAAARLPAFVLSKGLVAPLSEARPLQVVDLRACADGGVTARLAGSPAQLSAAVVHLVLTRFEPHRQLHGPPEEKLVGRDVSVAAGAAYGVAEAGRYQSGRRLGDEVRYVLERRRLVLEGRVRPMPALVDRPTLLMQPYKVRETETAVQVARRGQRFRDEPRGVLCGMSGANAPAMTNFGYALCDGLPRVAACPAPPIDPGQDVGSLGQAFCPPAVVLANVPVGSDGVVQVSPQQLAAAVASAVVPAGLRFDAAAGDPWVSAGHRVVRLVAYTAPAATVYGTRQYVEARAEVTGVPQPVWTDPRVTTALQRPFPAGSVSVERRSCHALQPGAGELAIADAATARLQLYSSVPKVWALFGSLLSLAPQSPWSPAGPSDEGAKLWSEFSCIGSWNKLGGPAKVQRFSQLASRELAFFLYCHDPEFFRTVVLPYLRLRLPSSRCCLDAWMAGVRGAALVEVWGAPHRYLTLTPLERILVAWEEDLASAAGGEAAVPLLLPRLARLAADMRARLRARAAEPGVSGEIAEINRRRFEIALNGPGQGDDDGGQGADAAKLLEVAFEEADMAPAPPQPGGGGAMLLGFGAPPPPPVAAAMPMAMPMAMPKVALFGAPAPPGQPFNGADLAARRQLEAAPVYRPPPATQMWAEAGWFRKNPTERQDPDDLSPESEFWADLAEHLARGGRLGSAPGSGPAFLPKRLESAGWGFSDALLATSVVGMQWEDSMLLSVSHGTRLTLTATAPTIAYVRQTAAEDAVAVVGSATATTTTTGGGGGSGRVLLLQRLLDPNVDPRDVSSRKRARSTSGAEAEAEAAMDEADSEEDDEQALTGASEGAEVPYGTPLVYGRLYCYSVTLTNTGPAGVRLDVTVQAPQGAVALGGRPALWVTTADLMPYGAQQLPPYYFYFPRPAAPPGEAEYDAYPAAASLRGKVRAVAFGQPTKLKVAPSLPPEALPDLTAVGGGGLSWSKLASLPPTPDADAGRLRYLAEGDLSSADLSLVLWRCRDAAFWRSAVAALRQRRAWDSRLWSYAVLHGDEQALRELLPSCEPLKAKLGDEAPAAGELFNSAAATAAAAAAGAEPPVDGSGSLPEAVLELLSSADRAPHCEFWPLVNARAHPLGSKRAILNDQVDRSWRSLLRRLAAIASAGRQPGAEDLLAAAYYLALQDRTAEASALLSRTDALAAAAAAAAAPDPASAAATDPRVIGATHVPLQLAYLRAWLTLADPDAEEAALRTAAAAVRLWTTAVPGAEAAAAAPPPFQVVDPKWQARLTSLASALEEAADVAAGGGSGGSGGGGGGGEGEGWVTVMESGDGGNRAATAGGQKGGLAAGPVLLLYNSPEGPRGAVVLEAAGVDKVTLSSHLMDLELLFSAAPFETTLTSAAASGGGPGGGAGGGGASGGSNHGSSSGDTGRFALLRPSWSTTLDIKAIAAAGSAAEGWGSAVRLLPPATGSTAAAAGSTHYKLLLQPHDLIKQQRGTAASAAESGALLLEAVAVGSSADAEGGSGGGGFMPVTRQATLACYRCGLRVVVQRERGVVAVSNVDTGVPVGGAYVKVYVKYDNSNSDSSSPGSFHKDGYTDRRGLLDFWTLTSKPVAKVRNVALFVSHPDLGSTVLHTEPPLQG